ncbi:MAG: hypothetical protein ABGY43_14105, partial [bacterium]
MTQGMATQLPESVFPERYGGLNSLNKITGIYELSVPLEGDITNAVVNFSAHDVSLVAVVSNIT